MATNDRKSVAKEQVVKEIKADGSLVVMTAKEARAWRKSIKMSDHHKFQEKECMGETYGSEYAGDALNCRVCNRPFREHGAGAVVDAPATQRIPVGPLEHEMEAELSALRLRVEELTHERDTLKEAWDEDLLQWAQDTRELTARAEKAERELGEARQAPKIELEQETDGRWLAEYKGIPGMMVYGATIGEALRKLADLIEQSGERTFEIT